MCVRALNQVPTASWENVWKLITWRDSSNSFPTFCSFIIHLFSGINAPREGDSLKVSRLGVAKNIDIAQAKLPLDEKCYKLWTRGKLFLRICSVIKASCAMNEQFNVVANYTDWIRPFFFSRSLFRPVLQFVSKQIRQSRTIFNIAQQITNSFLHCNEQKIVTHMRNWICLSPSNKALNK